MRRSAVLLAALLIACGPGGKNNDTPVCEDVSSADFEEDSGWGGGYCDIPTDLGCFPYRGGSGDSCGPFISMRTGENTDDQISACETLMTDLNCGTYTDGEDTTLSFFVKEADRLAMTVIGTYQGLEVDTVFYFNPCHMNCQAAITLETIEPDQQKLCEIPRQGKPICLFDEAAHSVTFVRADETNMVIRTAGEETPLERQADE